MQPRNTPQVPQLNREENGCSFAKPKRAKPTTVEPCEDSLIFSTMHSAVAHFFPAVAPASRQAKAIFNLRIKKLKCIFGNFTNIRKALLKEKHKLKDATRIPKQECRDAESPTFLHQQYSPSDCNKSVVAANWGEGVQVVNELLLGTETDLLRIDGAEDHRDILATATVSKTPMQSQSLPFPFHSQESCKSVSFPALHSNDSGKTHPQSKRSIHAAFRPRNSSGRFFRKPASDGTKILVLAEAVTDTGSQCEGSCKHELLAVGADTQQHFKWSAALSSHCSLPQTLSSSRGVLFDSAVQKNLTVCRRVSCPANPDFSEEACCEEFTLQFGGGRSSLTVPSQSGLQLCDPWQGYIDHETPESSSRSSDWNRPEFDLSFAALLENAASTSEFDTGAQTTMLLPN